MSMIERRREIQKESMQKGHTRPDEFQRRARREEAAQLGHNDFDAPFGYETFGDKSLKMRDSQIDPYKTPFERTQLYKKSLEEAERQIVTKTGMYHRTLNYGNWAADADNSIHEALDPNGAKNNQNKEEQEKKERIEIRSNIKYYMSSNARGQSRELKDLYTKVYDSINSESMQAYALYYVDKHYNGAQADVLKAKIRDIYD